MIKLDTSFDWIQSLFTDSSDDFIRYKRTNNSFIYKLKFRVKSNSDIIKATLYSIIDGDEIRIELTKSSDSFFDYWSGEIEGYSRFEYRFLIEVEKESFFWDASGVYKYNVANLNNFKFFTDFEKVPKWVYKSIIYHIFIDRFHKSKYSGENKLSDWGDLPDRSVSQFFGGNLNGIKAKITYLKDLGVNTICLTPIFESDSNHRYDVNDYQRVDSELGGNLNLIELSKNLENAGFRYILDGVFNHTGSNCKWFNNSGEGEKGAIQSLTSKYHNYYIFEKFPEKYACFWGEKHLPKLNWNSLELRKEIFLDEDSVTKKWLSEPFNASGWRIDASCMIGKYKETQINDVILGALYSSVKSINNDCIIIGENPFDPIEIKQYQHLDGITNYSGFYTPLELWLKDDVDFTVEHFKDALLEFRSLLGFQFTLTSKNFLSNHDKPRFFSLIGKNKSIYELSLIFLFTYPGIPTLYFGDEIGLYADELSDDSRICMKWENYDAGNQYWLRFTRRLIDIYQQHEIFQSGSFIEIHSEKDIYVFSRFSGHNCSLVILNKSNKEKIKPITLNQLGDFRGNEFNELLSGKNYLVNENNELELTNNSNSSLLVNVL